MELDLIKSLLTSGRSLNCAARDGWVGGFPLEREV